MTKGYFISIEGPDGAGKTTITEMVKKQLEAEGYNVVHTREPGGIAIAEQVRAVILDPKNTKMDARTEALLYAAARRQHLVEKVLPALEMGKIVLCDRFVDSSIAYQGFARGIGIEEVWSINQFAIENAMPQLTLYFDIAPERGLQRINQNKGREVNRLDLEDLQFHQKVYKGYEIVRKQSSNRIQTVNADASVEKVFEQTMDIVRKALQNKD
ncbi:dTMP kinase [Cytobacillus kochii]